MGIEENVKNAMAVSGGLRTGCKNAPGEYSDRRRQYFGEDTALFVNKYAKYTTNFVEARVQGLDPKAPEEWTRTKVRLIDVAPSGVSTLHKQDDYKTVLFEDRRIDYIRPGSKIETMGSTWLVTNPDNISSAVGNAVVQRCNAVLNTLDWYGNVQSEPLCLEKALALANDSDMQEYALITQGYYNIRCQKNAVTRELATNSRIILGSGAYRLTGVSDFLREFTHDAESVRMMEFTARYEPPNEQIDDMELGIAGGKNFSWEILLTAESSLSAGQKTKFHAVSRRCGEYVRGTAEMPVDYFWSSSDESVAEVSADGTVYAVASGTAVITCVLAQNGAISADVTLSVGQGGAREVAFLGSTPGKLDVFESVSLQAAYFDESGETDEDVSFTFSGADESAYSADVSGNTVTLTCWHGDTKMLVVTAQHGEYSAEAQIALEGI